MNDSFLNLINFETIATIELEEHRETFKSLLDIENRPVLYPPPGYQYNRAKVRMLEEFIEAIDLEIKKRLL